MNGFKKVMKQAEKHAMGDKGTGVLYAGVQC